MASCDVTRVEIVYDIVPGSTAALCSASPGLALPEVDGAQQHPQHHTVHNTGRIVGRITPAGHSRIQNRVAKTVLSDHFRTFGDAACFRHRAVLGGATKSRHVRHCLALRTVYTRADAQPQPVPGG